MFKQIFSITLMNILSIPSRWSTSSVIIVGIGGVVAVLVAIFSMAVGLNKVFENSVDENRTIMVRSGANDEMSSNLDIDDANLVASRTFFEIVAPELYCVANVPKKATGYPANIVVRGVTDASFDLRPELRILEGNRFTPGKNEIIVGRKAQQEFDGLEIGDRVTIREVTWTVVGYFEADGSAIESELWAGLTSVQSAFRFEGGISVVRARVQHGMDIKSIRTSLDDDPRLSLAIQTEADWYARQASTGTLVIRIFGWVITIIMSIGAIFAALNTMYSAIASRKYEIATLRAIGFGGFPVVVSVMVEALLLAVLGGLLGASIAYVAFNGFTVSTLNASSFSQIAFDFAVTPELIGLGLVVSLVLGLIGGLFPAIRSATLPVTNALRGE